jgi:hypothetical protein
MIPVPGIVISRRRPRPWRSGRVRCFDALPQSIETFREVVPAQSRHRFM